MRYSKLTYYLLANLIALMFLGGCAQDEILFPQDKETSGEQIQAELLLSVSMPSTTTRAGNELTLPGTNAESILSKITLFIIDGSDVKDFTVEGEDLDKKSLIFLVETTEGEKDIYVGANMSAEQIKIVKTSNKPLQTLNSISDVIGANGFLMTAQALSENGSTKINIVDGRTTKITANLERVVSKVLLTCKSDDGVHVKLSDTSKGYMRLADVHYALETTNKKFYLFGQTNNEDPNYSMSETLGQAFGNNFFSYAGKVEESGDVAIKTDNSRLNADTDPYTEGIYCLENTVGGYSNYNDDLSSLKQVATYIKIAAKFTPMYIDNETELTENEAKSKLSSQGGTFYVCKKAPESKKHICYSSPEAGIRFLNNNSLTAKDFTEHEGGWQRYEAFVASPTSFNEASNVKRNNYYIANVTYITAPIQEKTIEINTTVAAWTIKGSTTIKIETSK
ncbi:Mfa1 family fimbria major subunit [Bacteroides sp.]